MSLNIIFEHLHFMFTTSHSITKRAVKHFISKLVMLLLFALVTNNLFAQIKWRNDSTPFSDIGWDNYSTTYIGNDFDTLPLIVTAIPYNGMYDAGTNKELDMSFTGSNFRYQSNLSNKTQHLYTYDSAEVFFLTPGIFKTNAANYEFRVLENGVTTVKPWTTITQFTDKNFQLNDFKKQCGYLGGYKTTWDHFITVELRRKKDSQIIAATAVYWKQIKPVLSNIYLSGDMNEFLKQLNRPWDRTLDNADKEKWKRYDSINGLHADGTIPEKLLLPPDESSVIFYLNASIYKKEALEYSLIKDGKIIIDWKPNDFDNNFIWLQKLTHGDYILKMRFSKQRHNVTSYPFEIKARWDETNAFRIGSVLLAALTFGITLAYFLNERKLRKERSKTEQLQLEQRTVRSQLNPHFIFNALSSIQSLMNGNKITEANYYFTEFSTLLRDAMRNSKKEMLPLRVELQTLENYIRLEQLRFHFSYTISIAQNINTSNVEVPSLLLQPLIENAIKHGISSLQEKGEICIEMKATNKDLIISIQDNGKGFSPDAVPDGYGLSLTKERIKLINQSLTQQKIVFNINSNEKGTTVFLKFENWL